MIQSAAHNQRLQRIGISVSLIDSLHMMRLPPGR
jgi:hypothetical protein